MNPIVYEMSTFTNSLIFSVYDDSRKDTRFSFLWDIARIIVKLPRLYKKFLKNLTPQKSSKRGVKSQQNPYQRMTKDSIFCNNLLNVVSVDSA